ncbi:hypothetical protein EV426DRAFT_681915 [Tirmania nivea]|nr:hypothetical protein EV426DRAFT_681915 [Tirmania nivea]
MVTGITDGIQPDRNVCLWIGSCPNEKDNRDFRNDSRDDTGKVRSAEIKDKLGEDLVFAVNRKKYRIDGIEGIGRGWHSWNRRSRPVGQTSPPVSCQISTKKAELQRKQDELFIREKTFLDAQKKLVGGTGCVGSDGRGLRKDRAAQSRMDIGEEIRDDEVPELLRIQKECRAFDDYDEDEFQFISSFELLRAMPISKSRR